MVPTLWQRVADFPNTDNGKIDRKRLAENFVADSSLGVAADASAERHGTDVAGAVDALFADKKRRS